MTRVQTKQPRGACSLTATPFWQCFGGNLPPNCYQNRVVR